MIVTKKRKKRRNDSDRYFLCKRLSVDDCSVCEARIVSKSLFYTFGLTLIKGVLGFMTGSNALMADAVQSLMDCGAFGAHYSGARPNKDSPSIPLLSIGGVMLLSGVWICLNGLSIVISHVPSRPGLFALAIIWVSIFANWHLYLLSSCIQRYNPGNRLNALLVLQNRTNFISSIFAFVGILLAVFGFVYFDPLASIIVGGFQIVGSLPLLRESFDDEVWDDTVTRLRLSLSLGALTLCLILFFATTLYSEFSRRKVLLVPSEGNLIESPVSSMLGRAPYFCIIDLRANSMDTYINQERYYVGEVSGFLSALVKSKNVGVVLSSNIGPDVFTSFRRLGVRSYYIDVNNTVGTAVTAHQEGRLQIATSANVAKKFGRERIGWLKPWE